MTCQFVGVSVVPAMLGVENPRAKPREMNSCDISQALCDGVFSVFNSGFVIVGHLGQQVGAAQDVQAGLPDIIGNRAGADGLSVDAFERFQGLVLEAVLFDSVHDAVAFEIANGRDRHACDRHCARQAGADADSGQHVLSLGVQLSDSLPEPTLAAHSVRLGGVPDVHSPEVGPVGVGIADALNYRHLSFVVQTLERRGVLVDSQFVVDRKNLVFSDHNVLAGIVVMPIGIRHECVHKVVTAGHLDDYERLF